MSTLNATRHDHAAARAWYAGQAAESAAHQAARDLHAAVEALLAVLPPTPSAELRLAAVALAARAVIFDTLADSLGRVPAASPRP